MNKNPNMSGLKFRRKQQKLDQIKQLIAARAAKEQRYIDIGDDPDRFIDRYIIDYIDKYPGDVKIIKYLINWNALKKKYATKNTAWDDEV